MARSTDRAARVALLDRVLHHLASRSLHDATFRTVAAGLGVSVNRLVHHFGAKDEMIEAVLRHDFARQLEVRDAWLRREPAMSHADLLRKWWRWINASPENLGRVRIGLEGAMLGERSTRLPREVRAGQLAVWGVGAADRLVADGIPETAAEFEASILTDAFAGAVLDLVATGQRARIGRQVAAMLARVESMAWAHTARTELTDRGEATPPGADRTDGHDAGELTST